MKREASPNRAGRSHGNLAVTAEAFLTGKTLEEAWPPDTLLSKRIEQLEEEALNKGIVLVGDLEDVLLDRLREHLDWFGPGSLARGHWEAWFHGVR